MRLAVTIPIVVFALGCNSLLDETERIRKAYYLKSSEAPVVVATDPADGAVGPMDQNYIDISFSVAVESASVQSASGACTGSLQFSIDNFATCLGGMLDLSANPRVRFIPIAMPRGVVIRIRTLAPLANAYGKPALDYTSPQGVSFATACGSSNCFFSYSLPLMITTGASSGAFIIRSGTHQGKLLVFTAGQTPTTLIDFANIRSEPGPVLPAAPAAGAHTFPITQGLHAGKEMILAGGATTFIYDPATHSFSAGPAPAGVNTGAFSFAVPAGAQAGKTLTVNGNPSAVVNAYPDNLGNFASFATLPGPNLPGAGGHALRLSADLATPSYWFFVYGNSTTETRFFEESSGNLLAGPTLSGSAGAGAGSFFVGTGPLTGRIVTVLGGGSNATHRYNLITTTNEGAGPTLSQNAGAGGLLLYRHGTNLQREPLVLHGGVMATTTSRFDPDGGVFKAGPSTHGAIGNGSSALYIPSSTSQGFFFIVNGLGLANTQIYGISQNSFLGNTLPGSVPNAGAQAVYITSGMHSGRTLVIGAGSTRHTAFYDPTSHGFFAGPETFDPISNSGFSVPITRGAYAGRVVVFAAGGTNTYNVYNPTDGTFKSMVDLSHAISGTPLMTSTGANAFEIEGDGRILIVNGSGSTTQILDQESYAFTTIGTPNVGCTVNTAYNVRFRRPSDNRTMQLVWCNGTAFAVFDHVTKTFSSHTALGGGANLQAFVIPSGPEAGNIALVHGGGTTAWSILSAENLSTIGGVRSLAGCAPSGVGAGSKLIEITTGSNAGRYLLVAGNYTRSTCLFDPATLTFSPGPEVNSVNAPGYQIGIGSVAFPTRGGQYPTATVLLSGSNKNVWSTFVP